MAAPLRGGPIQNWYAPNITSDVREGIGKYSDEQLFAFLKKGVSPGMGVAAGPMSEAIHDSVSKMTDDDVRAIVAYLKSAPPKTSFTPEERTAYTGPNPEGREIYLNYCASCHQLDGKGLPGSVPSLAGNGAVMAKGPEDVIRVVLGGIEAQGDLAPMPAIGAGMTDQQVADVVNYVRQAWENKAPPTAGAQYVAKLRPKTFTAMNIGPDGHCPTVVQKQLAPIINDPKSGVTAALRAMTNETVLQTAHDLVAKVKAEAPDAKRSDIVNSLTIAYCPVVDGNNSLSWADKVATLDNFSERVYSELQSHEKE
ncbi:MAG TPA: cytochrome c [Rhodopila sp.]|nr:cytochrome c [Rhodopila sp.]